MIGVDCSKIRYYEKKGVCRHRREENGYRVFDELDAFRINEFIAINNRGYTIAESVRLLQGESLSHIVSGLEDNAIELEKQCIRLEEQRNYAKETAHVLRMLGEDRNRIWKVTLPTFYIHPASCKGSFDISQGNQEVRKHWLENTPFTRYVGFANIGEEGKHACAMDYGFAVREDHFTQLCYPTDDTVFKFCFGECICFYVEEEASDLFRMQSYPHVESYLQEQQLKVTGEVLLFYFMIPVLEFGEDGGLVVLPVQKK